MSEEPAELTPEQKQRQNDIAFVALTAEIVNVANQSDDPRIQQIKQAAVTKLKEGNGIELVLEIMNASQGAQQEQSVVDVAKHNATLAAQKQQAGWDATIDRIQRQGDMTNQLLQAKLQEALERLGTLEK